MNEEKFSCEIPEEEVEAMMIYYGLKEDPDSMEAQMRENGVSWKDFI